MWAYLLGFLVPLCSLLKRSSSAPGRTKGSQDALPPDATAPKEASRRASLVVQWLMLWAPNAGGPGSIPGEGTRSHMLQLRPQSSQINKQILKQKKEQAGQCTMSWDLGQYLYLENLSFHKISSSWRKERQAGRVYTQGTFLHIQNRKAWVLCYCTTT